jgi:hypothetical protein
LGSKQLEGEHPTDGARIYGLIICTGCGYYPVPAWFPAKYASENADNFKWIPEEDEFVIKWAG